MQDKLLNQVIRSFITALLTFNIQSMKWNHFYPRFAWRLKQPKTNGWVRVFGDAAGYSRQGNPRGNWPLQVLWLGDNRHWSGKGLLLPMLLSVSLGLGCGVDLRLESTRKFRSKRLWSWRPSSTAVRRGQWVGDLHKLQMLDHFCLHQILHVPWNHFIQNTAIRKIGSLQKALLKRRLWFVSPCSLLLTGRIHPWEDCPAPQCNRMLAELAWLRTVKKDVEPFLDPRVSNTPHWNRDWLTLIDSIASDHRVWLAFVREIRSTAPA